MQRHKLAHAAAFSSFTPAHTGYVAGARKSFVHAASLALVWLTVALSGIVFSEPAPVDALAMGLVLLLPVVGLVAITPALLTYLSLWLVASAGAFLAATHSHNLVGSATHTGVSLYLYLFSFVFAAFIACKPVQHTRLVLNAWMVAALIAAGAGLAGYFDLVPGAYDLFTKYGRVSGTFKDPNVFGPFVVPAFLYALHLALNQPARRAFLSLGAAGLLGLAVLVSFSRGAWVNLAIALAVYGYLAFVLAPTHSQRARIIGLMMTGAIVLAGVIAVALQDEKIAGLFAERANVTQSYDVGPNGRFGGQAKAFDLILDKPFGIGAMQFAPEYHHEEPHNVYLNMLLNAGWLGGGMYWVMVGLTLILGARQVLINTPMRPLFLIAYAAFFATAVEGLIVDTDHWRSFYMLMAMIWGAMCAPARSCDA